MGCSLVMCVIGSLLADKLVKKTEESVSATEFFYNGVVDAE